MTKGEISAVAAKEMIGMQAAFILVEAGAVVGLVDNRIAAINADPEAKAKAGDGLVQLVDFSQRLHQDLDALGAGNL